MRASIVLDVIVLLSSCFDQYIPRSRSVQGRFYYILFGYYYFFEDLFTQGRDGDDYQILPPSNNKFDKDGPERTCECLLPSPPSDNNDTLFGDDTLGQGTSGTWHILPIISMVDSVTCLRHAECSRAPDYINNGIWFPDADY